VPETDDWTCDLCGRAAPPPHEGGVGVTLELSGRVHDGEWGDWFVGFCSQEHAAEWLARPLPPPEGAGGPTPSTTWGDRAASAGCALVLLVVVAVLVVGTWTTVRFLLERP
jgi:hypothetical protein